MKLIYFNTFKMLLRMILKGKKKIYRCILISKRNDLASRKPLKKM